MSATSVASTAPQSLCAPERAYADVLTAARALDWAATTSANPSAAAPLRVKLSQHGVGLSTGVTGARFGVDAGGHPYVHAGRFRPRPRAIRWRCRAGRRHRTHTGAWGGGGCSC